MEIWRSLKLPSLDDSIIIWSTYLFKQTEPNLNNNYLQNASAVLPAIGNRLVYLFTFQLKQQQVYISFLAMM